VASCANLWEPRIVKGTDCEGSEYTADYSQSYECGVFTRTWTVTDSCGGVVSGKQIISIQNTTSESATPVIVAPPDVELECTRAGRNTSPDVTGTATASSSCEGEVLLISHTDQEQDSCGSAKTILRTWTATSACGISTSAVQKIRIVDSTPPSINGLFETSVTCAFPHPPEAVNMSDSCGGELTLTPNIRDLDCNGYTILWSVNDACDNYNGLQQFVTITDPIPPTIVPPANLTVECGVKNPSPDDTGYATASDNCGYVTVDFNDRGSASTCLFDIRRTWTATDGDENCGRNSASADQWITVEDTTAPSLDIPRDVTVACGDDTSPASTGTASATDACTGVTLKFDDGDIDDEEDYPPAYTCGTTISRTWIAEDECGNVVSAVQSITVKEAQEQT
jgi:hypothetical protein